ncbi:hypothetical protein [Streptomyces sp. NBC_01431]|uniref:hypothetical protein n=1 Tax=Streptomyces sp. NBC_01431 TaxID=2903863 RepID=UPI002E2F20DC|nr:hypothetical protein [Streptomyces sp. NBC_01431]
MESRSGGIAVEERVLGGGDLGESGPVTAGHVEQRAKAGRVQGAGRHVGRLALGVEHAEVSEEQVVGRLGGPPRTAPSGRPVVEALPVCGQLRTAQEVDGGFLEFLVGQQIDLAGGCRTGTAPARPVRERASGDGAQRVPHLPYLTTCQLSQVPAAETAARGRHQAHQFPLGLGAEQQPAQFERRLPLDAPRVRRRGESASDAGIAQRVVGGYVGGEGRVVAPRDHDAQALARPRREERGDAVGAGAAVLVDAVHDEQEPLSLSAAVVCCRVEHGPQVRGARGGRPVRGDGLAEERRELLDHDVEERFPVALGREPSRDEEGDDPDTGRGMQDEPGLLAVSVSPADAPAVSAATTSSTPLMSPPSPCRVASPLPMVPEVATSHQGCGHSENPPGTSGGFW